MSWKTSTPGRTTSRLSVLSRIVLVPFPFDDLTSTKVRPAVCLTDEIGPHHHVVLALIPSEVPESPSATDIVMRPDDPDFAATGLRVASAIRLHRLMTVSSEMIRRTLGTLPDPVATRVGGALRELFQL